MYNINDTNIINVANVSPINDYNPLRASTIKNSEILRRCANWGLVQFKKLTPDCDERLINRHFREQVKPITTF